MIIKVIIVGIVSAILSVILRQHKPEYSSIIAIACGIVIVSMIKDDLAAVVDTIRSAVKSLEIESTYISTLIKIIGIAYLTQFGASICEDAGEKAIAMKLELAGRLVIILMTAPIMFAIINLITGILP